MSVDILALARDYITGIETGSPAQVPSPFELSRALIEQHNRHERLLRVIRDIIAMAGDQSRHDDEALREIAKLVGAS